MRDFERLHSNLSLGQPPRHLCFIRALEPKLDCFFDHRLRVFHRFALADDSKLRTRRPIQPSSPGSKIAVSGGSFIAKSIGNASSYRNLPGSH
jgi:hypothetical protein